MTHRALWQALSEQGVSDGYIHLLDKLCTKQVGVVKTDRFSKKFNIEKGVKQGDPLSSLLFNSASEHIMRKLKSKSRRNGHGVTLKPSEENLTNLRFADDILLISRSMESTSVLKPNTLDCICTRTKRRFYITPGRKTNDNEYQPEWMREECKSTYWQLTGARSIWDGS